MMKLRSYLLSSIKMNVILSICTSLTLLGLSAFLHQPLSYKWYILYGSASFSFYFLYENYSFLLPSKRKTGTIYEQYSQPILMLFFLLGLYMTYLAYNLHIFHCRSFWLVIFLGLSYFVILHVRHKKIILLKKIPYLKTMIIPLTWTLFMLDIPFEITYNFNFFILFFWHFFIFLLLTLPFEFRDMESDQRNEIVTLGHLFSHYKLAALIVIIVIIIGLETLVLYPLSYKFWAYKTAMDLLYFYLLIVIYKRSGSTITNRLQWEFYLGFHGMLLWLISRL